VAAKQRVNVRLDPALWDGAADYGAEHGLLKRDGSADRTAVLEHALRMLPHVPPPEEPADRNGEVASDA
jgi:hypothetical protein